MSAMCRRAGWLARCANRSLKSPSSSWPSPCILRDRFVSGNVVAAPGERKIDAYQVQYEYSGLSECVVTCGGTLSSFPDYDAMGSRRGGIMMLGPDLQRPTSAGFLNEQSRDGLGCRLGAWQMDAVMRCQHLKHQQTHGVARDWSQKQAATRLMLQVDLINAKRVTSVACPEYPSHRDAAAPHAPV